MHKSLRVQPRVGVIDLGSNTVLLLVLESGDRVILERARVTRLGQGVFEAGSLNPRAMERTRGVIREFAHDARVSGAGVVVGVGTEALRRARDGREFLAGLVAEGTLDSGRLLAGEEEASLAIEASRRARHLAAGSLAVVDVGGGSTEVAWVGGSGGQPRGLSLPLGSVRLTEACVRSDPPASAELERIRTAIAATLAAGLPRDWLEGAPPATLVAVAGTATTLAALELALEAYDAERVEGLVLPRERLCVWIERLAGETVAERRARPGMEPGRADVIVAGLLVLDGVLAALRVARFRVSGRGVRHGVALRLLEGAFPL